MKKIVSILTALSTILVLGLNLLATDVTNSSAALNQYVDTVNEEYDENISLSFANVKQDLTKEQIKQIKTDIKNYAINQRKIKEDVAKHAALSINNKNTLTKSGFTCTDSAYVTEKISGVTLQFKVSAKLYYGDSYLEKVTNIKAKAVSNYTTYTSANDASYYITGDGEFASVTEHGSYVYDWEYGPRLEDPDYWMTVLLSRF